jgi:hypothetical protein
VTRWQQLLPGFDATQHLTGPAVVTDDGDGEVSCTTTVRGYHYLRADGDARTWTVAGRYRIGLVADGESWRISALTLDVSYEEGDRALVEQASSRVAAGAPARRPVAS